MVTLDLVFLPNHIKGNDTTLAIMVKVTKNLYLLRHSEQNYHNYSRDQENDNQLITSNLL